MIKEEEIQGLLRVADEARSMARLDQGKTRVGCAVLTGEGRVFIGANMEHWLNRSDHAEDVAILTALMSGTNKLDAVVVAAERKLFTPCGGCMDKVMQYGGRDCLVIHYNPATKEARRFLAKELMPFYPSRKGEEHGQALQG